MAAPAGVDAHPLLPIGRDDGQLVADHPAESGINLPAGGQRERKKQQRVYDPPFAVGHERGLLYTVGCVLK